MNRSTARVIEQRRERKTAASSLAHYEVRDGGIFVRGFNVRVATFAANSATLRAALRDVFEKAARRAAKRAAGR